MVSERPPSTAQMTKRRETIYRVPNFMSAHEKKTVTSKADNSKPESSDPTKSVDAQKEIPDLVLLVQAADREVRTSENLRSTILKSLEKSKKRVDQGEEKVIELLSNLMEACDDLIKSVEEQLRKTVSNLELLHDAGKQLQEKQCELYDKRREVIRQPILDEEDEIQREEDGIQIKEQLDVCRQDKKWVESQCGNLYAVKEQLEEQVEQLHQLQAIDNELYRWRTAKTVEHSQFTRSPVAGVKA